MEILSKSYQTDCPEGKQEQKGTEIHEALQNIGSCQTKDKTCRLSRIEFLRRHDEVCNNCWKVEPVTLPRRNHA